MGNQPATMPMSVLPPQMQSPAPGTPGYAGYMPGGNPNNRKEGATYVLTPRVPLLLLRSLRTSDHG